MCNKPLLFPLLYWSPCSTNYVVISSLLFWFSSWTLYGLQSEHVKDIEDKNKKIYDIEETNKKIKKARCFENVSLILETTLETSFQMWFQTMYLFPLLLDIFNINWYDTTNGSEIIWRIISILSSLLSASYTNVYTR